VNDVLVTIVSVKRVAAEEIDAQSPVTGEHNGSRQLSSVVVKGHAVTKG
jgi:hypothetical protein